MSYPAPLTATLTGASVGQLAYWRRNQPGKGILFAPEHGTRPRALYSYRDVIALRMFVRLRGELSLQKLRKVVAWLDQHSPDTHLSAHRIKAVRQQTAVWISPDGEYVDVVERPGQGAFKVVMDDVFNAFTAGNGRRVPDLREPTSGVIIDPAVRGGFPVLEGTRVPFDVIASLRAEGLAPDEIAELYPAVRPSDIDGAVELAALVAESGWRGTTAA
jgi:uncharacterized protein (DUF433 family)